MTDMQLYEVQGTLDQLTNGPILFLAQSDRVAGKFAELYPESKLSRVNPAVVFDTEEVGIVATKEIERTAIVDGVAVIPEEVPDDNVE